MSKKLLSLAVLLLIVVMSGKAQINMPQPSPTATLSQPVGLTTVTVEYSRPGLKDREAFGGLVQYGEIWRTGANASTKIEFSTDVTLEGNKVPAGKYALYTIPGEDEWTIIIHKNLSHWGVGQYAQDEDQVRFTVKPMSLESPVETFTIGLEHVRNTSAHIALSWENTKVRIGMEVSFDELVMADIKTKLSPNYGNYYQAATYYYDNDKDLNQALEWIDIAIEGRGEAFWYVHLKAKILAAMGEYKDAIKVAEESKSIASKADNDFGYVALNEQMIAKWKKMK